ncbi:hypothetical protein L915_03172 [Phytophthora nicotianae]|uniref:Uncharacterized protein n=1 Tax=Phytophthora nicotianae TaxID=4792 RepID=W2HEI4_PHYNI|nr:hypothetical protein L915_03172 [Phytophthora nicotianae]
MVVRRGRGYTKEDVLEALDRAYEGEKFVAVARTSSVALRTLFKKSQELQTTGEIAEKRRGSKPALSVKQKTTSSHGSRQCSVRVSLLAQLES